RPTVSREDARLALPLSPASLPSVPAVPTRVSLLEIPGPRSSSSLPKSSNAKLHGPSCVEQRAVNGGPPPLRGKPAEAGWKRIGPTQVKDAHPGKESIKAGNGALIDGRRGRRHDRLLHEWRRDL